MISIAMTTYNGEKYLREQLDSILNQTVQDFELVICDDCSKDSTVQILNEYSAKDKRVKVFVNEQNLGFKKNFEKAINLCTGDYIAFCDQDDVWNKNKLELSLNEIKDKSLLCTNAELVDSQLNPLGYTMEQTRTVNVPQGDQELLKYLVHYNFVQGATVLARSDFIKKYMPIPSDIKFHDWYFAICAVLENGIAYLCEPTLKYRQHTNNVTENTKKTFLTRIRLGKYNTHQISLKCKQSICFVELISKSSTWGDILKEFLEDTKKYYECLPQKKFYILKYVSKYYYLFGKNKGYLLFRRFLGIVRYKLFLQNQ